MDGQPVGRRAFLIATGAAALGAAPLQIARGDRETIAHGLQNFAAAAGDLLEKHFRRKHGSAAYYGQP